MDKMSFPKSWLICNDTKDWHERLDKNYLNQTEVWLQISKAQVKEVGIKIDEAVEEAICYGWIDGKMFKLDEEKYILRFTPSRLDSYWSKKNKKRAEELIGKGRVTEFGMEKVSAARKNGNWENAY